MVSFLAPCVLPLVPAYLSAVSAVDADRLGQRGTARRVVASSLPFVAGFTAFFVLLGIGAALVGGRVLGDQFLLERVAGFVLVVFGLAFMGLLPWPERLVGAGPAARGTRPRIACPARRRFRDLRRAVHRPRARRDPRPRRLLRHGLAGSRAARRLLPRPRRALRARRGALHARDVGLSLAPRPLPRDPDRRRRDHGRARPAPLLRALLRPPRLPEPRARDASGSSPRSDHTRGAGRSSEPAATSPRARETSSSTIATSTPRWCGS